MFFFLDGSEVSCLSDLIVFSLQYFVSELCDLFQSAVVMGQLCHLVLQLLYFLLRLGFQILEHFLVLFSEGEEVLLVIVQLRSALLPLPAVDTELQRLDCLLVLRCSQLPEVLIGFQRVTVLTFLGCILSISLALLEGDCIRYTLFVP